MSGVVDGFGSGPGVELHQHSGCSTAPSRRGKIDVDGPDPTLIRLCTYTGPAPSAYLYYGDSDRSWAAPLGVGITP
jgi:hypothetical protein